MSYPTIPWPTFADLKQMLHEFWASKPTYTESQYPDLQDKVVIVTGVILDLVMRQLNL